MAFEPTAEQRAIPPEGRHKPMDYTDLRIARSIIRISLGLTDPTRMEWGLITHHAIFLWQEQPEMIALIREYFASEGSPQS